MSAKLLDNLQYSIQKMVAAKTLMPITQLELNGLCVAIFGEDCQWYSAKIIGYSSDTTQVEVFFIYYGK